MKTITSLGLILAILGSLGWLYYVLSPKGIDLDPYQVLGQGAAKETAKLLQSSGRLVLVRADFGAYKLLAPTTEAQIKSFKEGIGKTHMTIVAVEKVPISPPSMARPGIFTQPGQISELIARHPEADAIVFFVGLAGPDDLAGIHPDSKPKVVLVGNFARSDQLLLQKGLIQLVIVQQPGADAVDNPSASSASGDFKPPYCVLSPRRAAKLAD